MLRALLTAALFSLSASAAALAGTVRVEVRTPNGEPVANAVVTVSGPASSPLTISKKLVVEQKDLHFQPFVLVVPRGASVAFPNLDQTRHHVYSFSAAGPFELKLYGSGETRSVRFDKLGTIAVGCNIHDQMSAFIRVTDAPWATVTDAAGVATIPDVDPGQRTIEVWHPLQRGSQETTMERSITVPANTVLSQSFELAIRKPLDVHTSY
jgi:plastocyanin